VRRIFHIFTEPVLFVNRWNNEARAHVAIYGTNVSSFLKMWKTRREVFVDIWYFFTVYRGLLRRYGGYAAARLALYNKYMIQPADIESRGWGMVLHTLSYRCVSLTFRLFLSLCLSLSLSLSLSVSLALFQTRMLAVNVQFATYWSPVVLQFTPWQCACMCM